MRPVSFTSVYVSALLRSLCNLCELLIVSFPCFLFEVKSLSPGESSPFSPELLHHITSALSSYRPEFFGLKASEKEDVCGAIVESVATFNDARTILQPATLLDEDFSMECVSDENSTMARSSVSHRNASDSTAGC